MDTELRPATYILAVEGAGMTGTFRVATQALHAGRCRPPQQKTRKDPPSVWIAAERPAPIKGP